MATLALRAESTIMHIVTNVAADTGNTDDCATLDRRLVAGIAIDFLMCTHQRKTRLAVIEIP